MNDPQDDFWSASSEAAKSEPRSDLGIAGDDSPAAAWDDPVGTRTWVDNPRIPTLTRPSSGDGRLRRRLKITSAALVLAIGVIVFLSVSLYRLGSIGQDRRAAIRAARTAAIALTNFDYKTIDKDISKILEASSASFRKEYARTLTGSDFRDSIIKAKGSSSGEIKTVAVTSSDHEGAQILVVVQQKRTNSATSSPASQEVRVFMTMIKTPSGWKIDRLETL